MSAGRDIQPRHRSGDSASGHFDVVVVGARCAGAPLATLLARAGARVAVVEQAQFPRDTLSSHVIQTDALAFLRRLGVIEQVRATGARFMSHVDARLEDARVVVPYPQLPGDVGGAACIRRFVFDPILADAAAAAGAQVQMGTKVVGVVEEDGRVAGVRTASNGSERVLRARLVVGADGRSSTIARLCGSRASRVAMRGSKIL
jgi:flavin-dependent dehydrogenase